MPPLSLELFTGGILLGSLTFYVLMGGADYGAGVWTLLAQGRGGREQRRLIAQAIAPIWEANHVWLILVVTVLFTAFPPAFAAIATQLHIPLTLMLIGIVLRGAAFAFRTHDIGKHALHPRLELIFAVASVITPVVLGVTIGTIASGRLGNKAEGFVNTFIYPWLAPFPLTVGLLALAQFALLAAVYLSFEAREHTLREAFRRRALVATVMVAILAVLVFVLSGQGAPQVRRDLGQSAWGRPLIAVTGALAIGTMLALIGRQYGLARVFTVGQVIGVLWGWAWAQFPYLIVPDVTIYSAAASSRTLAWLLAALLFGAVLLFPSMYYLFRVFKGRSVFRLESQGNRLR